MTPEKASRVTKHLMGKGATSRWSLTAAGDRFWVPFMGGFFILRSGEVLPSEAEVIAHEAIYDSLIAKNVLVNAWQTTMADTDAAMPRPVEDIIGTMSDTQKAKLPQYTQDAYAAKVTLRGEKP